MNSINGAKIVFKSLQLGEKNTQNQTIGRINDLTDSQIGFDLFYNSKDFIDQAPQYTPTLQGGIITRNDVNAKLTVPDHSNSIKVEITDTFDEMPLTTLELTPDNDNIKCRQFEPGQTSHTNQPFSIIPKTAQGIVSLISDIAV